MGSRAVLISTMDHAYIDANSIAERYLDHALSTGELADFEQHIVDCQECGDRLLLAEMFHARNGHKPKPADEAVVARVVVYKPKRVIVMLIAAALAIPLVYVLWTLISKR